MAANLNLVTKETPMAAPNNFTRLAGKIASSGGISAKTRAKTATFRQPGRTNGQKERFPMPDKEHARLALQFLPRAKNMPPGMAAKVRNRANRMLGQ